MKTDKQRLTDAYDFCHQLAQSHYENFPVASPLIPKQLRKAITVIYAFARSADDIADEGDLTSKQRQLELDRYQNHLDLIKHSAYQGSDPIFIALSHVITCHNLPIEPFNQLITAFKQDIKKARYQDLNELLDYCQYSANPVGRLLLHLNQTDTHQQIKQSDAVCTALQLINFFQDVKQDLLENNRIYLPSNAVFNASTLRAYIDKDDSTQLANELRHYFNFTVKLFNQGYPLGLSLNGRIGWEIRTITLSAITVLHTLSQLSDSELLSRPRISKRQVFTISIICISKYLYQKHAEKLLNQI